MSDVDPLPRDRPADAAEVPQVTDESSVERVLLRVAVLQVHDALAGHELPGGAVHRGQVQVHAQQEQHDHREHGRDGERPEHESVLSEPLLPGGGEDHAGP